MYAITLRQWRELEKNMVNYLTERECREDAHCIIYCKLAVPIRVCAQLLGSRFCVPLSYFQDIDGILEADTPVTIHVAGLLDTSGLNESDRLYLSDRLDADGEGTHNAGNAECKDAPVSSGEECVEMFVHFLLL